MQRNRIRQTRADRISFAVIYGVLGLVGLITFFPLWYVVIASISDPTAVNSGQVFLLPKGIHLDGYRHIFENQWVLTGYRNSLIYTVLGTALNLVVTFAAAYALSRKDLPGHSGITVFMIIPMWFSGGLIPTFITVSNLGLVNKPYTLIIMGAISMYNCIICRTFIQSTIPEELQEASRIDGCSDIGIMLRVVLPLSAPVLAILTLYYGLGHWNDYFTALIYLNDRNLQPLQTFLRMILILNESLDMSDITQLESMQYRSYIAQVMRYSLIVVASLPMLILYPFVQKYFVKGVMIGAVKG